MFNNCNAFENGEYDFFSKIKNNIKIIFDVGSKNNSIFLDFENEVHYFEPMEKSLNELKQKNSNNSGSFFNNYGLGNNESTLTYYLNYESFVNRNRNRNRFASETIDLQIKKAEKYIVERNISAIDFLKIDTEGFELEVIKGFGEFIKNVKIIQFEYGGTYQDKNIKLLDVINYLKKYSFNNFYYLDSRKIVKINNYNDHYQYCNIVTFNDNFDNLYSNI